MKILLERRDVYLAVGGILLSIASGFLVALIPQQAVLVDLATNYVPSLLMLVGIVFIYLGRKHFGGQLERCLDVVGVATAILFVGWVPHFIWHVLGMTAFFGISAGFWLGLFHMLTGGAFAIYFYGFYLFLQAGQIDRQNTDQTTRNVAD